MIIMQYITYRDVYSLCVVLDIYWQRHKQCYKNNRI